jgi:tetratricopeptide (TPR) repeat protein
MRFEFLALLAYRRISATSDQAWVHRSEVAVLPRWAGNSKRNIETNLGRYLQQFEKANLELVSAPRRWKGPYRLEVDTLSIDFDVSIPEVKKLLRIPAAQPAIARRQLYRFTVSYTRSQWLVFQGRLGWSKTRGKQNALSVLLGLTGDRRFNSTLRALALLGAVQVLFRIGRFQAARKTLLDCANSLMRISDNALKSVFYHSLAWSYQRATSGAASNREVEDALRSATALAEASGDRAALGLAAHRTAGYLTKKGLHIEAVNHLLRALELHLAIGNYELAQATCGNIGSVLHRLGPAYYKEARRWILLGIEIARWMRVGRDNAHGEMILAKMYIEGGNKNRSYWLLKRAERIASTAENKVNLGDVKMGWAFWHQRFGTNSKMRDALIEAVHIFRGIPVFDRRQKQEYLGQKFPDVWPAVLSRL